MFAGNSFGKTLDLLHRSMDVTVLRRDIIADNIANADTPNFKRSEVNFESQLAKALESEKQTDFPGVLTNEKHIAFNRPMNYKDVVPTVRLDYLSTMDNNGNNVDVEVEMMADLRTQLLYDLMVTTVQSQLDQVKSVLT